MVSYIDPTFFTCDPYNVPDAQLTALALSLEDARDRVGDGGDAESRWILDSKISAIYWRIENPEARSLAESARNGLGHLLATSDTDSEQHDRITEVIADCDRVLGNVYSETGGGYEPAIDAHDRARASYLALAKLPRQASNHARLWINAAICDRNLGNVHRALGRTRLSMEHYQAAMRRLEALPDDDRTRVELAKCRHRLGLLLLSTEVRPDESDVLLHQALATFQDYQLLALVADCHRNLGILQLHNGRPRHALRLFKKSREISRDLGRDTKAALSGIDVADAYLAGRKLDHAWDAYQTASDGLPATHWVQRARIDLGKGRVLLERRPSASHDEQRRLAEQALDLMIPAMLALDSQRFDLTLAEERRSWAEAQVLRYLPTVLNVTVELGEVELLADLIESAKAFGRPRRSLAADTAIEPDQPREAGGTPCARATGQEASTTVSLAWTLGVAPYLPPSREVGLPLGKPGPVRIPDRHGGRLALNSHHATANSRFGHTNVDVDVHPYDLTAGW